MNNKELVRFCGEEVTLISITYRCDAFDYYPHTINNFETGVVSCFSVNATFYTKDGVIMSVDKAPVRMFEFRKKGGYKVGRHD